MPLGVLLVMETLEDEQYVVIKAYKFTVFEIWRDFNVLSYIACPRYPYIRVCRLCDGVVYGSALVMSLNGIFSSMLSSSGISADLHRRSVHCLWHFCICTLST